MVAVYSVYLFSAFPVAFGCLVLSAPFIPNFIIQSVNIARFSVCFKILLFGNVIIVVILHADACKTVRSVNQSNSIDVVECLLRYLPFANGVFYDCIPFCRSYWLPVSSKVFSLGKHIPAVCILHLSISQIFNNHQMAVLIEIALCSHLSK